MKKKNKSWFILASFILMAIAACNSAEKKEESTEATDTTKTEAEQPVVQDATPDAVKAASDLYKVLADSGGIRVLEVNYKPGDSSALHSHPDNALYMISGGTATFYGKDGSKMEREMKTGMTAIGGGDVHTVKNTGKTPVKAILVEVSRSGQTSAPDAATDATKVAPDVYKVKSDSAGIRVLEVTAKPGKSVAMHSHPAGALYVLEGGSIEFTNKDGSKQIRELKKGMAAILPAESHSAKNTGKTTLKAILVEVSRAQ